MKITPDMESESGGQLIDLADFQDDDETGIKATVQDVGKIRIKVDSYNPFGSTIWLDPDDAEAFGHQLIAQARKIRGASAEEAARLTMSVDRLQDRPRDCAGCDWTYWGDRHSWRLTHISPACPVHGPKATIIDA
jgi:hypothetical protein